MIEQNYFKSSKDTGALNEKQKKLAKMMGISSRDYGAPRKERQIRRGRSKRAIASNQSLSSNEEFLANNDDFSPENQLEVD
jgi:hypothetical protein